MMQHVFDRRTGRRRSRIRDAFAVVCGPMPFLVGLIGGAGLGYGAHELSKPKV
jgi:hypothetical protein